MKTKVYDKAVWHIDNGLATGQVLGHFSFMLEWCNRHHLLSGEGKEILMLGIDDSISLHSRMFTDKGNAFMDRFYDKYISAVSEIPDMVEELNSI